MGDQLKNWINYKLHDVLGMSDSSIADYLMGLCRKESSESGVLSRLKEDMDIDQAMVDFISELWNRIKGKTYVIL